MADSIKRHGAGQQQQLYGANLTNCQFVCLALTLSLGTISQWYDYTGGHVRPGGVLWPAPQQHAWGSNSSPPRAGKLHSAVSDNQRRLELNNMRL
jgi:hypothetical protein